MLDPTHAEFWVLIAFLAFFGIIAYLKVPGMVGKALDDRADAIRTELDQARKLREEAQELLAEYQKKARTAEDEAKQIIDQARRDAEALAAETRISLKESLERRTKLAEEKIARAEAQAMDEVRASAIDAAVGAAENILRQRATGSGVGAGLIDAGIRELKDKLN